MAVGSLGKNSQVWPRQQTGAGHTAAAAVQLEQLSSTGLFQLSCVGSGSRRAHLQRGVELQAALRKLAVLRHDGGQVVGAELGLDGCVAGHPAVLRQLVHVQQRDERLRHSMSNRCGQSASSTLECMPLPLHRPQRSSATRQLCTLALSLRRFPAE